MSYKAQNLFNWDNLQGTIHAEVMRRSFLCNVHNCKNGRRQCSSYHARALDGCEQMCDLLCLCSGLLLALHSVHIFLHDGLNLHPNRHTQISSQTEMETATI